jgi:hypothetical protein
MICLAGHNPPLAKAVAYLLLTAETTTGKQPVQAVTTV